MSAEAWIAAGGLFVTILGVSGAGLRILFTKLESNKDYLSRRVDMAREHSDNGLEKLRAEVESDAKEVRALIESRSQAMGEVGHALRTKVGEVELRMVNEFVKQKDYDRDQERVLDAIKNLDSANERRLREFKDEMKQLFQAAIRDARSPN